MNRKLQLVFWFVLFFCSRAWVWSQPPYHQVIQNGKVEYQGYSDVKQDYERYANMWKYGLTPYFEHLYEYPPATIPVLYLPLEEDLKGLGNYYQNYRAQILLLEHTFFLLLEITLFRLPIKSIVRALSLIFYIVAGMWAKDYWYEGLDLLFTMSLCAAIQWRYLCLNRVFLGKVGFWTLFWLSTAIKFMTVPLVLPYLLIGKNKLKEEVLASGLGFLIVWFLPLAYYRSSLSVSVVFHLGRPLKYGSLGTWVVKTINDFTGTEIQTDILPHLPMAGPVTEKVEALFGVIFPVFVVGVILSMSFLIWRRSKKFFLNSLLVYSMLIKVTLVYFMILFLTTKVFSSPFHIWYVPLIAMLPYERIKEQLVFVIMALWMLGLDTTTYIKVSDKAYIGLLKLERLRDAMRFIPMIVTIWLISRVKIINTKLD